MSEETKNTAGQEQELDSDQLANVAGGDGTTQHYFTVEIKEGRTYSKPDPSIKAAETG